MRKRGRVDANQKAIVDALRAAGASVMSLANVGNGCPDLAVGHSGETYLLECKSGRNPLTPAERKFKSEWRGRVVQVVRTPKEALQVVGAEAWREQAGVYPEHAVEHLEFVRTGEGMEITFPDGTKKIYPEE